MWRFGQWNVERDVDQLETTCSYFKRSAPLSISMLTSRRSANASTTQRFTHSFWHIPTTLMLHGILHVYICTSHTTVGGCVQGDRTRSPSVFNGPSECWGSIKVNSIVKLQVWGSVTLFMIPLDVCSSSLHRTPYQTMSMWKKWHSIWHLSSDLFTICWIHFKLLL